MHSLITTYTEAEQLFVTPPRFTRGIAAALLLSLMLHALLYGLISPLRRTPSLNASRPVRDISVVLQILEPHKNIPDASPAETRPETPSTPVRASSPLTPVVDSPPPPKPVDTGRTEPALIGDLTVETEATIDAAALIAKSRQMAGSIAREMESLVDGTAIFDKDLREQLETARRKEQSDAAVRITAPPREVGNNQFGDLVIRENGHCSIIPRDLFFYTFKEINSIIPMTMGTQCGGGNSEKFSLLKE